MEYKIFFFLNVEISSQERKREMKGRKTKPTQWLSRRTTGLAIPETSFVVRLGTGNQVMGLERWVLHKVWS